MTANLKQQVDALLWFHSIDFGNGLVSSGRKSKAWLDKEADTFFGAISLTGRTFLDIGAWNGFFSFEAKRRGARRVVATDHYSWTTDLNGRAGFDLARANLGLEIEAKEIDVGELSLKDPGAFDVVFFAGVFYHLFEAPRLLQHIASLATKLLIVETYQDLLEVDRPAMAYYPGSSLADDPSNFWGPNPFLVRDLLLESGYARVFYRDNSGDGTRGVFYAFRNEAAVSELKFRPTQGGWIDAADWRARPKPVPPVPVTQAFKAPRTLRNLARFLLGREVRR